MTKLNITNKKIYKLKKHKNQSQKNVPKKRKNKKRGHLGRSFRKRRKKYNIKNISIKKYKKQKGGVKTDTDIISDKGKVTKNVFKSKQLQALEKKLGNVQRKIEELGNTYKEVTAPQITAKRIRFTNNEQLVRQLTDVYNDMTQEEQVTNIITELKKLHKDIGNDDDIKKLSNRQMEALKLKTDIEHTQNEIDLIKPILNAANQNKKDYEKATDKKKRDVKKQEKAVVEPAELERLQDALDRMGGTEGTEGNKYNKQSTKIATKKRNSEAAELQIKKLNDEFNTNWGTWETDDDTNKNKFIEEHLKGDNMTQGPAKDKLTYLEVIKYALKDYEKSVKNWKQKQKDENLRWKTIEKESEDVSDKITAESLSKEEEYNKGIATETAKKEKLEKEIEALTKKEDEKLSAETDEIAKGLKTGKIEGLEGNIKQQEDVLYKSHEETEKAKKEEKKLEKKLKKTEDGTFLGFTKEQREKRKADAVGAVRGKLDVAEAARLAKETEEKEAEGSLRAKTRWKKGVEGVGSLLLTKIKCSLIVPYVDDNEISRARIIYNETQTDDAEKQKAGEERIPEFQKFLKYSIESFRVLTDQPYIYNPEGPYAQTTDDKQSNKMGEKSIKFHNYYLKKAIKSPDGEELSLVEMISQRIARYINYVMGHNGTDEEKKSHKETIAFLNRKIQELFKPNHLSIPIDKYIGAEETKIFEFRHHSNEKTQALIFLEILLRETVESFPQGDLQRYTDLMETSIDGQPLFDIFCSYLGKCYDAVPEQKLIELETESGKLGGDDNEIMKKGLDEVTFVNETCVPPDDDNGDLYMRVSRGIDLYSKDIIEVEEKEKQEFLQALKNYEEHAKDTEEMKKEIQGLLPELQDKIEKIKKEKYFGDSIKEELDKVKRDIHATNVVAEQLKIKNNTKQLAQVEAAKAAMAKSMAKTKAAIEENRKQEEEAKRHVERLQKELQEAKEKLESQKKATRECDQKDAESVKQMQELLDKKEAEVKAIEIALAGKEEDQKAIASSLNESEQQKAEQEAEDDRLARKEAALEKEKKELIALESKDEDDGEEEEDIDLWSIIDEMGEKPGTDVELEFPEGQREMVIYAAYDPNTKQVSIEHRILGSQGKIEDVISNYGIGTEAAN